MRVWTVQEWAESCSFDRCTAYHRLTSIESLKPRWRLFRPLVYRTWKREYDWAQHVHDVNDRAEHAARRASVALGPDATFKLHPGIQPRWLVYPEFAYPYAVAKLAGKVA